MSDKHDVPEPVIVDTSHSPHAALRPVPLTAVTLTDTFWKPRRELNRTVTLRTQYQHLEETGRLDNFRRAAGTLDADFQGIYFNDSDVYKWLEGAAWALAGADDPELASYVDTAIAAIEQAQGPDGYLNTYFTFKRAGERWTNLRDLHELYCAGHLFQAAVAHHRATGSLRLLNVARRFADLICETFGPEADKQAGTPGHPEIEMGLVELARAAGEARSPSEAPSPSKARSPSEARYLAQATYFLDARGHGVIGGSAYHQDHVPFRDAERLAGHAVRALYLSAGAADILAETGEGDLDRALDRLWRHMSTRQAYITGGLGARHQGEAVGADFELPNAQAYAETCAGIANAMWAWRMLQLRGDPTYADFMERALYNAALSGISLDGTTYFYVNPLATDRQPEPGGEVTQRQPWFGCACCPPNVARTLAQMPGYLYGVTEDTIWLHLYAANEAEIRLPGGQTVRLIQRALYPWSGQITLEIMSPGNFTIAARIPAWCASDPDSEQPSVSVNGSTCPGHVTAGTYVHVSRTWAVGDALCIQLPMPIHRIESHPLALENTGRVALMRGPLLYCLEAVDHPGIDLRDVGLPAGTELTTTFRKELLGGIQTIEGPGLVVTHDPEWETTLYRPAKNAEPATESVQLTAIPYFAWANREVGAMQVWLRAMS